MVPDYACDGEGADDLKSGSDSDDDKKDDDDRKDESVDHLQEAIANLLRKHLRG